MRENDEITTWSAPSPPYPAAVAVGHSITCKTRPACPTTSPSRGRRRGRPPARHGAPADRAPGHRRHVGRARDARRPERRVRLPAHRAAGRGVARGRRRAGTRSPAPAAARPRRARSATRRRASPSAGRAIFGLSTQDTDYQREAVERLHLPYPILSDADLELTRALDLPTFEVEGMTLIRRVTLIVARRRDRRRRLPGVPARPRRRAGARAALGGTSRASPHVWGVWMWRRSACRPPGDRCAARARRRSCARPRAAPSARSRSCSRGTGRTPTARRC